MQEHSGGRGRTVSQAEEHTPVLAAEALEGLALEADGYYVDATFGRGGHTALLLEALGREGRVLAVDRDPQAIEAGRRRFADEVRLTLLHASFADLGTLVPAHAGDRACRGVLFDLGVSSPQLDDPARGFSFRADGPLDMRMDPTRGEPVSSWLARARLDEIRQVIATFGEERFARRVAQAIVARRETRPLTRTAELVELVAQAVRTREPGKHPATRTFQALRMFINDELGQLERGLTGAVEVLSPGGRLAAISFHSLEDRAVKRFLQRESQLDPALRRLPVVPAGARPRLKLVGRKQRPGAAELARNPRARSALLRLAERLP
ncbi:MAG: 16S rRNA (cytosine(1402)-N(4))-methyltransferase RsmH [Gammaproteobacteria bacterium]|nr:16S rRNA (cytosine(1402)-N(4))-methyltransferase RsmH [Gammaproteobacteria bacterium]MBV9696070.1 16S rRNA (cytosine(1402)-N(4))-methyltransferase RsmH [Gammaproteobacteria bacterium]